MCRKTAAAIMTMPLVLIVACERQPDTTPAFQHEIHDSAGIRIIQNPRPDPDSRLGWQVGSEPVITIGSVEAEEAFQLHRVDDALKLRDGRIVVVNGGSYQLLVFDAGGNYLTAWGQQGDGPGEFGRRWMKGQLSSGLFWAEPLPGDSIAVCHDWWYAVSIFDSDGKHGRTLDLMRPEPPPKAPQCRDVLPSGALIATRNPAQPTSAALGVSRRSVEFLVLNADGTLRASLGVHPGAELYEHEAEDFLYFGDPPFMRTVVWSAWGEFAIVSPTDRYEIRAYTSDGSLARIVRREHNVPSPTQADLDLFRAAERPIGEPTQDQKWRATALDAFPLPESFPAFSAIEVEVLDELGVEYVQLWGLDRSG